MRPNPFAPVSDQVLRVLIITNCVSQSACNVHSGDYTFIIDGNSNVENKDSMEGINNADKLVELLSTARYPNAVINVAGKESDIYIYIF